MLIGIRMRSIEWCYFQWPSISHQFMTLTSVYTTVGVRHRVVRVCQRQRRLVTYVVQMRMTS